MVTEGGVKMGIMAIIAVFCALSILIVVRDYYGLAKLYVADAGDADLYGQHGGLYGDNKEAVAARSSMVEYKIPILLAILFASTITSIRAAYKIYKKNKISASIESITDNRK